MVVVVGVPQAVVLHATDELAIAVPLAKHDVMNSDHKTREKLNAEWGKEYL